MNIKPALKKVWWFIWESNSVLSWIVSILLAVVIIKFLLYPGLGLALSTSHPVVAVVSNSMHHSGDFHEWWNSETALCDNGNCAQAEFYLRYNITENQFAKFKFKNGFNKGDIIVLHGVKPQNIKVGDTIVFKSMRPDPIIHRVIKKWQHDGKWYFQTKGDNNAKSIEDITLNEYSIPEDSLIGRALFKIPYLGWIKIGFIWLIRIFMR